MLGECFVLPWPHHRKTYPSSSKAHCGDDAQQLLSWTSPPTTHTIVVFFNTFLEAVVALVEKSIKNKIFLFFRSKNHFLRNTTKSLVFLKLTKLAKLGVFTTAKERRVRGEFSVQDCQLLHLWHLLMCYYIKHTSPKPCIARPRRDNFTDGAAKNFVQLFRFCLKLLSYPDSRLLIGETCRMVRDFLHE